MSQFAWERFRNNRYISLEIRQAYQDEIQKAEKQYGTPIGMRRRRAFQKSRLAIISEIVLICAIILWPIISDSNSAFKITALEMWLDANRTRGEIYVVLWFVMMITAVILFVKIRKAYNKELNDAGKAFQEKKEEIIEKYENMGYYPEYEDLYTVFSKNGRCAYYDVDKEAQCCPVTGERIGFSNESRSCFSSDFSDCRNCETMKSFLSARLD